MTTDDLREAYLDFFEKQGCVRRPSDVLVPNDPTVLFTPAGMNQFKREFMGLGDPNFKRATTVYLDDDEAFNIWHDEIKIPANRISRLGEDDNFWPAGAPTHGPNGVCGPCSEIFYHGNGPKEVEIWNLVFTQFNRVGPGQLEPLPSKNIDTGMGLERAAACLQSVPTVFDIDIFRPIVTAVAESLGLKYDRDHADSVRIRRMAD